MNKDTQKKLLKLVKDNYNDIAGDFSVTRQKKIWPEIENIVSAFPGKKRVLDVACGDGRLLQALPVENLYYLGVDNSEGLIEEARKRHPNFKFAVGDMLELGQIPEINFDLVFCLAALHHLPGNELRVAALKQLKNKVADDGRIIISVWNLWPQKKYLKLIIKFWLLKFIGKNRMDFGDILFDWKNSQGEKISQRYYHAFTKRELKKLIKKSGFTIDKLYKDRYNYYAILTQENKKATLRP